MYDNLTAKDALDHDTIVQDIMPSLQKHLQNLQFTHYEEMYFLTRPEYPIHQVMALYQPIMNNRLQFFGQNMDAHSHEKNTV
jgi:hypothetical protein